MSWRSCPLSIGPYKYCPIEGTRYVGHHEHPISAARIAVDATVDAVRALHEFRQALYGCLTSWADALFELSDAVLCSPGPVVSVPSRP